MSTSTVELIKWHAHSASVSVKEIGVPDLLSLPSTMLEKECHLTSAEVCQARHLLLTEAHKALVPVSGRCHGFNRI